MVRHRRPGPVGLIALAVLLMSLPLLPACGGDDGTSPECDSEPEIMTTADGVEFVRTPDACFQNLPGFPYEAKYVEIDGLRQAYIDEGPADADPILLLHGQPSWSYLYRKMIPVLVDAGYRVIAMDHLGMGRSDKPINIEDYSYLGHVDRLEKFIKGLGLKNITLFAQDWGSLIGLHVAGEHPEWFARIVIGDGTLPVIPAGVVPFPPVENPDELNTEIVAPFAAIPPQQPPFYDEDGNRLIPGDPREAFGQWMAYAMTAPSFHASEVVEAMTYFDVPADEEAAYDAPFPSRIYMAGPRVFPSLANELPGVNDKAWAGLTHFEKPFLTIWASNDPGQLGGREVQDNLINNIPGAAGQPHTRLPECSHFLQDDQGVEIARLVLDFIRADPREGCLPGEPDPSAPLVTPDDIPIAHTPGCGWEEFPPPVLEDCTEPLAPEVADLRGLWETYSGTPGHVERIEQCGNRVVITGNGVTHDMRADGVLEHGVNDVSVHNCQPLAVAAEFADGQLQLRPFGGPVLVTRELDGDELVLVYLGSTSRLKRICNLPE
jgi:haloalkane dehalogenase